MYQDIIQFINDGEWELAEKELESKVGQDGWCNEAYILAATIYMSAGKSEQAYEIMLQGLKYDYQNYELYLLLGNYYETINVT